MLTRCGLVTEFPKTSLSSPGMPLADGSLAGFDTGDEGVVPAYMQPTSPGVPMTDQQRRDWAPVGGLNKDTTMTFCGASLFRGACTHSLTADA